MAYVTIPKDLTKVKSKVLFGLTKRQLICFGAAALIGVPLFFLPSRTASNSAAAFCMIIVMLPFFLLAMYERHGQPLEVVAGQIIRCMFLRTKERPYQTNNFYAALERQAQVEKEVKAIVQKAKARAAGTAGGKTGTAQTGQYDENGEELLNYWFSGFYPADDPRYTITVLQDGILKPETSSAAIFAKVTEILAVWENS